MALITLLSYKIKLVETLESAPSDSTPSPRRRAAPPSPHAAPLPSPPSAGQLLLQRYAGTASLSFYLLTSPPLSPKSSSLLPRSGASSHLPLSREGLGCFRHAWIRSLTSRGPPRWSAGGGCASRGACVASSPCGTRPCQDWG